MVKMATCKKLLPTLIPFPDNVYLSKQWKHEFVKFVRNMGNKHENQCAKYVKSQQ